MKKKIQYKSKYAAVSVSLDSDSIGGLGSMKEARKALVSEMAKEWAKSAKEVTSADNHIDTAAYINSLGFITHYLGPSGSAVGPIIHEWEEAENRTTLKTGSGVPYAIYLEGRYNIYARGLENGMDRMISSGMAAMKKVLRT
ncbi:hypothetical protein [Enterococcus gilvus]|uniref:HK97 gp10 family phage protein n=2 Tax=Enterococcus gilvus TaxID=160453 RepID=R2Y915_9ENTE|nr:hypothetical protein [Enterococcus gilvus]EOI58842.1 hypothetical protein UKC_00027 [Enterococcus gilvus ATCC BAA-350]EOW79281.1 hypothetical protein I592_03420 [Enterococcus gilvus ATCC BAA-350]OJG40519.1 hypothetical protein RV02_GL002020 [Enterococcus gilvus]